MAGLFFTLPASQGFLLAGGAALLAQHLTARPTEDLDFFTTPETGHVPAARDALEAASRGRGWSTERIHDSSTFCRLVIRDSDGAVIVDLAVNALPDADRLGFMDYVEGRSAGKPIARLTPIVATADSRSGVRFGGIKLTKLRLASDFHAPLTDDDLLNP